MVISCLQLLCMNNYITRILRKILFLCTMQSNTIWHSSLFCRAWIYVIYFIEQIYLLQRFFRKYMIYELSLFPGYWAKIEHCHVSCSWINIVFFASSERFQRTSVPTVKDGPADTMLQSYPLYPSHPLLLVRVMFARDDQRRHSSRARICGIASPGHAGKSCVTIWRGN